MSELRDVELARPGKWRLSTGPLEFTAEMLRDAADFYTATGGQGIPIAPGHTDDRFDGDPSFGRVVNIRYAEDARGPVLLGDLVDMADWVAAAAPRKWPNRSVQGFQGFEYEGRVYALALTKLALLGSSPPAIPGLRALQEAVAAAAAKGAVRIAATSPETDPSGTDPAGAPPSDERGAGMDPVKIREALGLPADASDADVKRALAAAGLTPDPATPPDPSQPPPPPGPDPVGDPGQPNPAPAPSGAVDLPRDVPQPLAAAAAAAGAVVLDKGVWNELQDRVKVGEHAARRLHEQDRDNIIAAAVNEGRIPPANKDYWARLWDRDPKGTTDVIASLQRNLIPVQATGYMGSLGDDDAPDPYAPLFPPTADAKGR